MQCCLLQKPCFKNDRVFLRNQMEGNVSAKPKIILKLHKK